MSVFQWIEEKDVLTARIKVSPGIDRFLIEIRALLTWTDDQPGALPKEPSIDALERVAAFALFQIASCPDSTLSRVDALVEQLGQPAEDGDLDGYPSEDAPENYAFVLGAYAIFNLDRAIGHYANGEHSEALDAMAEVSDAMHACGFHHGRELGIEHGHRANSSKGGLVRNAPYKQLQEWATDRYRAGKWKSAHQASHELRDVVLTHAKSIEVSLSPYRAQQTIYGWFLAADKAQPQG